MTALFLSPQNKGAVGGCLYSALFFRALLAGDKICVGLNWQFVH